MENNNNNNKVDSLTALSQLSEIINDIMKVLKEEPKKQDVNLQEAFVAGAEHGFELAKDALRYKLEDVEIDDSIGNLNLSGSIDAWSIKDCDDVVIGDPGCNISIPEEYQNEQAD